MPERPAAEPECASGPLAGLLVADFSRVLAGPLAAMTLGDLGADVIKVERPDRGDDSRAWGPPYHEGTATYYLALNRNKRSVALDLGAAPDRELARRLALRADVLIESFRPGLMARWGLDHATLALDNPGLVMCSISAFGTAPQAAARPGYDLLLQAVSGLMSLTGEAGGRPMRVGAPTIDAACGLQAAIGILAALQGRERSGRGQLVEVALMDCALAGLINHSTGVLNTSFVPGRMGTMHPSLTPYETFPTADEEIVIAAGNDDIFGRLCEVLGRPELATDPDYATNGDRLRNRVRLAAQIRSELARAPAAEWVERLTAAAVPAGPINDIAQAFELSSQLGLEPVDDTGGVRTARSPLRLKDTPVSVRLPPPGLDEHGDAIRAWLQAGA